MDLPVGAMMGTQEWLFMTSSVIFGIMLETIPFPDAEGCFHLNRCRDFSHLCWDLPFHHYGESSPVLKLSRADRTLRDLTSWTFLSPCRDTKKTRYNWTTLGS